MFFRSRILLVVLVLATAGLLFMAVGATLRSRAARRELDGLEGRISDEQRSNERAQQTLDRMQQPAWLALLARARLNYKAAGETVVFVYKSAKDDIVSQPNEPTDARPNWRKWWDWLLKR